MTKYIAILCVFLAVCAGLALWRVDVLTKQNTTLEIEKNSLTMEIERRNKDVLALSNRKKELEQAAANDEVNFDWYYRIDDSTVIDKLRKQCKSCPTRAN